jgi:enhancing lycopene biosynthesis protein 2
MKFAIILAGCGQYDGSETHEVIATLLALEQEGLDWQAFAPDIQQARVINHVDNTVNTLESRSVLQESARLVRGRIKPLSQLAGSEFSGIIIPGGFGAVTTLSTWLDKKADFTILPELEKILHEAQTQNKPTAFICIAPIMIPKIYPGAHFTIGNDATIAAEITAMGCTHVNCAAEDIVIDERNKLITTPANMVATNINQVYVGIRKLVQALKHMCAG